MVTLLYPKDKRKSRKYVNWMGESYKSKHRALRLSGLARQTQIQAGCSIRID